MIIVKLTGGLGNQMFQYAFGKHLAHKYQTKLKLDISFFESQNLRSYELYVFNINEEIVTVNELNNFFPSPSLNFIKKIFNKIKNNFYGLNYVLEKQFNFTPEILNSSNNSYLDGYWQSEKYFKDSELIIRDCFQFKIASNEKNKSQIDQILSQDSVSIHIRRGDYVSDKQTNKIHGTCDERYYDRAIFYISENIKTPVFYVFSDDIDWAKKNIEIPFAHHYVENNADCNYEDIRLMAFCKHNIIANSSFSWWGAWLNSNVGKIVIAPEKWNNDTTKNTGDIVPKNWVKL
ncbi:MAG: alpha-1,2-fucosyltransferase [Bacteroidetes bacterium]|nr:alpha-1,2-fucosyltransferase [Bacteroidota bacterium]